MVCNRCILVVKQELEQLGLHHAQVSMGEIDLEKPLTKKQEVLLNDHLKELGFELLDDQKQQLIEKIRSLVIKKIQDGEIEEHFILSLFLAKTLKKDYSYLSRLFSAIQGITIEQFFILQKIEKVKELLVYNEWSLGEIAWKLGYSSIAHLSAQFKKITGLTPSSFKKMGGHRKSLDQV